MDLLSANSMEPMLKGGLQEELQIKMYRPVFVYLAYKCPPSWKEEFN